MTDKKLLELAAKAAGYEVERYDAKRKCLTVFNPRTCTSGNSFAPLMHDGDALRLAVKLKIDVHFEFDRIEAVKHDGGLITEYLYELPTPTDPYAATRRAIVRAAAEIGKTQ